MSTNLFVRKEVEQGLDEKGRRTFSKVEVADFGNNSDLVDAINWHVGGLANCSSAFLEGADFLKIRSELEEDIENLKTEDPATYTYRDKDITDEQYKEVCEKKKQYRLDKLQDAIADLNYLIESEGIEEDNDETYEVHLWY